MPRTAGGTHLSRHEVQRSAGRWLRLLSAGYLQVAMLSVAAICATIAISLLSGPKPDPVGVSLLFIGAVVCSVASLAIRRHPHASTRVGASAILISVCLALAVGSILTVNQPVRGFPASLGLWLLAIVTAIAATLDRDSGRALRLSISDRWSRLRRDPVAMAELTVVSLALSAAAALRLVSLDAYPSGVHGDEGGMALTAIDILRGVGASPFGRGFFDLALPFWYESVFLAAFGTTLVGARLFSAVNGVLALVATYALVRTMFGRRIAFLALLVLGGNAVHVHFSRQALNVILAVGFTPLALLALWRAATTMRSFWWMVAGILGGLSVYAHFDGRVTPVIMAVWVFHGAVTHRERIRDWLKGCALAGAGGLLALAPMFAYVSSRPDHFFGNMSAKLILNNLPRAESVYHTQSPILVVLNQLWTNLLGFVVTPDRGFYAFANSPLLPQLLAPLFVLSMVLLIFRIRDPRYALLAYWFWGALIVNGVLTIDSPQAHRLIAALIPAAIAIALSLNFAVDLVGSIVSVRAKWTIFVLACALPIAAGISDARMYFGPAADARPFEANTAQARYVAALGPGYYVYTLGAPLIYFDHPTTKFLALGVEGTSLNNPALGVPASVTGNRDVAYLVYPTMGSYLPMLRRQYPNASIEVVTGRVGPIFTALRVPAADLAPGSGQLTAIYADSSTRMEPASALGRSVASDPARVRWSGSLFVPRRGQYAIGLDNAASTVEVDGRPLVQGRVSTLGQGWHSLMVSADVGRRDDGFALQWREDSAQPRAIPGEYIRSDAVNLPVLCRGEQQDGSLVAWRMSTFGVRSLVDSIGAPLPRSITCEAVLKVTEAGAYDFVLTSAGDASLLIDGRPVGTGDGRPERRASSLSVGTHHITLENRPAYPGQIELGWARSGGSAAIISPGDLTSVDSR